MPATPAPMLSRVPFNLLLITVGSLVFSVGVKSIAVQHGLITGGITGVGLLCYYHTGALSPGLWYFVINLPLFLAGWLLVSRRFFFYSVYGMTVSSLFMDLVRFQIPVQDPFLAVLAGGAVIGAGVRIGKGTEVGSHVVIKGPCTIGRDNRIFQFASIGEDPQDLKYAGERTYLEIGDRNRIREFATIHRGTVQDASLTSIGSDNLLMAYTHVAHDCRIGSHVIMANASSLGGHVHVDDWAILGGFSIVHQFCRVGGHCFLGMGSVVSKDVPPYVTVSGHPARPHGINTEGLKRRSFDEQGILAIKRAYKCLYKSGLPLDEAIVEIQALAEKSAVLYALADFLRSRARSIVR